MDAYDFAANRLSGEVHARIKTFWEHFAKHADGVDRCFSSNMDDMQTDPTEVMGALENIDEGLMWEFGPSDKGHRLCITAEWRHDLRALARAVLHAAPDLPRFEFYDVRLADEDDMALDSFKARFRRDFVAQSIEAKLNDKGRIDLSVKGPVDEDELVNQAGAIASIILGEEKERDWIGVIDAEKSGGGGLLGRFSKAKAEIFDPTAFEQKIETLIEQVQRPDTPYAQQGLEDRAATLVEIGKMPDDHLRSDAFLASAATETYLSAILSYALFSSRNHSRFNEVFTCLRIERLGHRKITFDDVGDRYDLEAALHNALSTDGTGGYVASCHGTGAVYIDLALADISQALPRITQVISDWDLMDGTTLTFLDEGLENQHIALSGINIVIQ